MIRINLLPHREEKRRAKRGQFYALSGVVVVLSALAVGVGYFVLMGYDAEQEDKNTFLKNEIAKLDKEIQEIRRLKDQTDALLSRKRVIESLQGNRGEAVRLFNELIRQVPEGIYIKSLKQADSKIVLTGYSQSSARVSTLMRNLEASDLLERPDLVEIKSVVQGGRKVSEFNLNIYLTRVAQEVPGKPAQVKAGR